MLIKTLLNKVERFKSFVYGSICVMNPWYESVGQADFLNLSCIAKRPHLWPFGMFLKPGLPL